METLQAILKRRSIRKFTGEVISNEHLKTILRAGLYAPSAHNLKPIEYVVIQDEAVLQSIADNHKYAKMITSAKTGVLVCASLSKEKEIGFAVEDGSATIQNMLLAAYDLGLGAVWCGIYPKEPLIDLMKEILNLPEDILPIGLVVIGHSEEIDRNVNERYDESLVHYNKW